MERTGGKRPWLAALLGTFATGLGHLYLRRWRRGLGWFAAAVAVSYLFVPMEATQALLAGENADPVALAPVIAVSVASIADAYVVARRDQQRARQSTTAAESVTSESDGSTGSLEERREGEPGASTAATTQSVKAAVGSESADSCPHCGKELDPELDFCPWCTTRLDSADRTDN
ncbi:zinc ribbon domain-containing protein [Halobellus salinisoli]|uniref:zinc ribbon domain-containing protein n=1 Tax=Halobellus salinisoli TaxID=3108500 RepID=UPI00300A1FB8